MRHCFKKWGKQHIIKRKENKDNQKKRKQDKEVTYKFNEGRINKSGKPLINCTLKNADTYLPYQKCKTR